jgi:hypothetical protein
MPDVIGGYQPDTKSPSARRADFDLLRRIAVIERNTDVGVETVVAGSGITVNSADPANPIVAVANPPAWTTITLGLGWVAEAASHVPAYRIIGDLVYIRGVAQLTGTFAAGTLATLPIGVRPPRALRYNLGARKVGSTGPFIIGASISSAGLLAISAYSNTDQVNPLLYLDMIPPYSVTL